MLKHISNMTNEKIAMTLSHNLLDIPEYVLQILLSYLDATSLYQLSRTCVYLKEFIDDPIFWKYVDARKDPNTDKKVTYIVERINKRTTHLFLRSAKRCGQLLTHFFHPIKPFQQLRVLALENQKICGSKVSLKEFPARLEELSLKKSLVRNSMDFFKHSAQQMQNLRVLILDECNWVTSSFLLSVSKYENLEIISAVKCLQVHLNMVPYLNVAKYGCKKLKVLDMRFTGIGGQLLKTLYCKQSFQNLYFQSFGSSEVDHAVKIDSGSSRKTDRPIWHEDSADLSLDDNSLREYIETTALTPVEAICNSVLYTDPYPKCTCQDIDRNEDTISTESPPLRDDFVFTRKNRETTTFVCHKHLKEVENMPKSLKDFFFMNQRQTMSDVTSDVDSDSDTSDSDQESSCCIYAMGTRMFVVPDGRNISESSEIVLPRTKDREDVPFNIVIVNTEHLIDRSARLSQPSTSRRENVQREPKLENGHGDDESGVEENSDILSGSSVQPSTSSSGNEQTEAVPNASNGHGFGSEESSEGENTDSLGSRCKFLAKPSTSYQNKRKHVERSDDSDSDSSPKKKTRLERNKKRRRSTDNRGSDSGRSKRNRDHDVSENDEMNQNTSASSSMSDDSDAEPSTSTAQDRRPHDRRRTRQGYSNDATNNRNAADRQRSLTIKIGRGRTVNERPNEEVVLDRIGNPASPPPNDDLMYRMHEDLNNRIGDFLNRYPMGHVVQIGVRDARWPKKKISLRRLSLRGYKKITDATLRALQNLDLELLDLTYTSVTRSGMEEFLSLNPNCRIIHPFYCICKPRDPFLHL